MSQGEAQGQRLNSVEMDFSPSFLGVLLSSPKSSIFVVFFFQTGNYENDFEAADYL